jgi:hypothetical protein
MRFGIPRKAEARPVVRVAIGSRVRNIRQRDSRIHVQLEHERNDLPGSFLVIVKILGDADVWQGKILGG